MEYIDDTKIESKVNKHTFVWKKSTERNHVKLLEKIKVLLDQTDDAIAQDNTIDEGTLSFTSDDLREHADKLDEYDKNLKRPANATHTPRQTMTPHSCV